MKAQLFKQDSLVAAVKANNFDKVKKILDNGGLTLDKDFSDYHLLIQALILGNKKIAKLLLDNGCRIFCQQKKGIYNTPLYYAVNLKCLELVKILLDKGASVKGKDANKETPLVFAMKNKYFEIVDLMLLNYEIKNTNINNHDEVAHFHIAVMRNNTKLVKAFLEHGMKVDQTSQIQSKTSEGYTPLHFAVEHHSVETVKLLLSNRANFGLKNAQGSTPLHLAFYLKNCKENDEIIDLILSAHLKNLINPVDKNGISHFHIACSKPNLKLLKAFLKSGASCNNCIFNNSNNSNFLPGYSPLHIAVNYKCKNTVKFLLDNKADVNKEATGTGVRPLHLAVKNDDMEIVKLLLQYNADVCATDIDNNTAIHAGLEITQLNEMNKTRKAILDLLLSVHQGNLKNVSNKWGVNLFHIACSIAKDPQIIKNFLKQNRNINAYVKNNKIWAGYSALHFAVMTGNLEIIQILLQNNVALKMTNSDEHSPLYWICKIWFEDAIKAITFSAMESPSKTLMDEDFKADILNRLRSVNENRFQIFKLFLQREKKCDSIMFDVIEMMFHLSKEAVNSKREIYDLKLNQLITIFKTVMITLIDHGYDINKKDNNNTAILHCVIKFMRIYYSPSTIEIIESLLIRGAQVDIETNNDITPLMMAASEGFYEVVDILLKYKANPHKQSKNRQTPLHFALSSTKICTVDISSWLVKVVDLLLAKGVKINVQDNSGSTPLHYAAELESLHKCLLNLLRHNCKVVNSQNALGHTALHIACIRRNLPGLVTLLDYGADINLVDRKNLTPLQDMLFVFCPAMTIPENVEMLKILELHIIKLNCIGFKVSDNNLVHQAIKGFCKIPDMADFADMLELTKECISKSDENENLIFIDFCLRELKRMKNVKIDMYTSLYSIIFKNEHEVSKTVHSEKFKELLKSNELKENFPLYGYMLHLQYKKGLRRYTLLQPAKFVLQNLLSNLPDLCYERILASFTNQELKKLVM